MNIRERNGGGGGGGHTAYRPHCVETGNVPMCGGSRPTWELFIPLHPSDGGSRLTAHGGAGHLRLIALAQHLIPGLDDGVTGGNYDGTHKQNSVNTGGHYMIQERGALRGLMLD